MFALSSDLPGAPPVGRQLKNPPAVQEMGVQSLGQEDPPEKGMAIHSSILAWKIPWTEEPDVLQSMGSQELDMIKHACCTPLEIL